MALQHRFRQLLNPHHSIWMGFSADCYVKERVVGPAPFIDEIMLLNFSQGLRVNGPFQLEDGMNIGDIERFGISDRPRQCFLETLNGAVAVSPEYNTPLADVIGANGLGHDLTVVRGVSRIDPR